MQQSDAKGKGQEYNALCKGSSTRIGDGRQKPARPKKDADLSNSRRSEGTVEDVEEQWKREWENGERCRSLYLEKAAEGAILSALPEVAVPNATWSHLGWKQKRVAFAPSPRLQNGKLVT